MACACGTDNISEYKEFSQVNYSYSDVFDVQVGVHQGVVLNPLLSSPFVLEALSQDFRTGCPLEAFCADDLVKRINTMDEPLLKMDLWRKTPRCQRNLSEFGKD